MTVWPQDNEGLERLCRYLLRCPLSLSRIHWTPGSYPSLSVSRTTHPPRFLKETRMLLAPEQRSPRDTALDGSSVRLRKSRRSTAPG